MSRPRIAGRSSPWRSGMKPNVGAARRKTCVGYRSLLPVATPNQPESGQSGREIAHDGGRPPGPDDETCRLVAAACWILSDPACSPVAFADFRLSPCAGPWRPFAAACCIQRARKGRRSSSPSCDETRTPERVCQRPLSRMACARNTASLARRSSPVWAKAIARCPRTVPQSSKLGPRSFSKILNALSSNGMASR